MYTSIVFGFILSLGVTQSIAAPHDPSALERFKQYAHGIGLKSTTSNNQICFIVDNTGIVGPSSFSPAWKTAFAKSLNAFSVPKSPECKATAKEAVCCRTGTMAQGLQRIYMRCEDEGTYCTFLVETIGASEEVEVLHMIRYTGTENKNTNGSVTILKPKYGSGLSNSLLEQSAVAFGSEFETACQTRSDGQFECKGVYPSATALCHISNVPSDESDGCLIIRD